MQRALKPVIIYSMIIDVVFLFQYTKNDDSDGIVMRDELIRCI